MPCRLVVFGRFIALTFFGDDMQHFWTLIVFNLLEDAHQILHIMSVCWTKIADVQSLEDIAWLLGQHGFEVIRKALYLSLIVVVDQVQLTCQTVYSPAPFVIAFAGGYI